MCRVYLRLLRYAMLLEESSACVESRTLCPPLVSFTSINLLSVALIKFSNRFERPERIMHVFMASSVCIILPVCYILIRQD